MNINFEYHEVSASPRLEAMITEKLNKLENKYDFIVGADVYFKKENTSNPEEGKICSIRISMPGPTIFAENSNASFEAATAKAINEVSAQLQKRKEKMQTHQ
ncbi:ribosome hibernation-promoting factor, HPF/YfiA family [Aequorivita echinoideorum]|uniref:Ribosome-associated translation inhibitor RaiA n=1 Tax=Aequorivita echinoideorum TaxID=1549647 RepID=A0ABS5S631_9FLAO|nr:ribosome-associated translation inhibitor RaiA [Aequorivita echinoideorum]MBT0608677.1 ribosome-associated translation inhibitor RaiA [Aequorivita echinoideorum]